MSKWVLCSYWNKIIHLTVNYLIAGFLPLLSAIEIKSLRRELGLQCTAFLSH